MDKTLLERFSIGYFSGTNYWEVFLDGECIHTADTKEDAELFVAMLLLKAKGLIK